MLETQEAIAALDEIIESVHPILAGRSKPKERPRTLYHFTNSAGLLGIISEHVLRASLATALNDATEIVYCIHRACDLCDRGVDGIPGVFLERVKRFLVQRDWIPRYRIEFDAYVVSFCARADLALQWLHYGRSGSGCAIAFTTEGIEKQPFDLVSVIYKPDEQDEVLSEILKTVFKAFAGHIGKVDIGERVDLTRVAAQIAAQYVWIVGALMKDPAFAGEEEWRLITIESTGPVPFPPSISMPMPIQFRTAATRIVPFMDFSFDYSRIDEIILGHTVSMEPHDPALAVLLRQKAKPDVRVSRSLVKVRD
jgi:hypothetical protein